MVEPLAGSILNSLRPARLSFKAGASSVSRHGMKTPSLATNFFTPVPRDVKGKKKATDVVVEDESVWDCRRWACVASQHSIWCSEGSRALAMRELADGQDRPLANRPRSSASSSGRPPRHRTRSFSSRIHTRLCLSALHSRRASSAATAVHVASASSSSYSSSANSPTHPHRPPPHTGPPIDHYDVFRPMYRKLFTRPREPVMTPETEALFAEFFLDFKQRGAFEELPVKDRVQTVKSFLYYLDTLLLRFDDSETAKKWASWLLPLIDLDWLAIHSPETSESCKARSVLGRLYALTGEIEEAQKQLEELSSGVPRNDRRRVRLETSIMLSLAHYRSLADALAFATLETDALFSNRDPQFRELVHILLTTHPDSSDIVDIVEDWEGGVAGRILRITMSATREMKAHPELYVRSLEALARMKQPFQVPPAIQMAWAAISIRRIDLANRIARCLPVSDPHTDPSSIHVLRLSMRIASIQGDIARCEEIYHLLHDCNSIGANELSSLLSVYAKNSDVETLRRRFDSCFPPDGPLRPNEYHYSILMNVYAKLADVESVVKIMERMKAEGRVMNDYAYGILCEAYARTGRLEEVFDTLEKVKDHDSRRQVYTSIVIVLGSRNDFSSLQSTLVRASDEGIIPDLIMYRAMINAYAETGNWAGLVRLVEMVRAATVKEGLPTTEIYNLVLKALVLLGTPFKVLGPFFRRLEKDGFQPDQYSYGSLIQSAVDSRQFQYAIGIIESLIPLHKERPILHVSHFTSVISFLTRLGDKEKAKRLYQQMLALGIKPTTPTIAALRGEKRIAIFYRASPRDVRSAITKHSSNPKALEVTKGNKHPLIELYQPLLVSAISRGKLREAERHYVSYLQSGGTPSISLLSILLHGYRSTKQMDRFLFSWREICRVAQPVPLWSDDGEAPKMTRMQDIQLPLSTFITTMSHAGLHDAIFETCTQLRKQGLEFDVSNWNHLLIAFLRAGRVSEAFGVGERIIIPMRNLAYVRRYRRHLKPSEDDLYASPYSQNLRPCGRRFTRHRPIHKFKIRTRRSNHPRPDHASLLPSLPRDKLYVPRATRNVDMIIRRPLRHGYRRVAAVKHLYQTLKVTRKWNLDHLTSIETPSELLLSFRQIRAHYAVPRFHKRTLNALVSVYLNLRQGRVIQAATPQTPGVSFVENPQEAQALLEQLQEEASILVRFLMKQERRLERKAQRSQEQVQQRLERKRMRLINR